MLILAISTISLFYMNYFVNACNTYSTVTDCQDVQSVGFNDSGVYHVTPPGTFQGVDVYCDMVTDGGGWIVIQRRQDGSENFYRDWNEYQKGFGNVSSEFWLGNLLLHVITSGGQYEVRFELEDWEGNKTLAKYKTFKVGDSNTNYTLTASSYTGDAGDSMKEHNGQPFTTFDRDNDRNADNCAEKWTGAWWYKSCHHVNLNGQYKYNSTTTANGIIWKAWHGYEYSLKKTEMKIRRR